MASTKLPFPPFLLNLLRFVFKKTRDLPLQLFSRIWNVIATSFSKLYVWRKNEVKDYGKPSLKIGEPEKTTSQSNSGSGEHLKNNSDMRSREWAEYSDHSQQEPISLVDIACSLYPYASGGIPNASRSSQNLQLSLLAHSSRNSSRPPQSTHNLGYSVSPDPSSNTAPTIAIHRPTLPSPIQAIRVSSSSRNRILLPDQNPIELEPITLESPQDGINMDMLHPGGHSMRSSSSNLSTLQSVSSRSPSPLPENAGNLNSASSTSHLHFPDNAENLNSTVVYILDTTRLNNDNIVPVMPQGTTRYKDKPRIKCDVIEVTLPPLTTEYDHPLPPTGWTRFVHPEGARYFSKKSAIGINIWTESNILNSKILEKLEDDIATMEQFISNNQVLIPDQSDLVVNVSDGNTVYYFANHPTRTIFFLDYYQLKNLEVWWEAPGAESLCHIRYEIEAQYWFFILLFPHALNVTKPMVQDLRGSVLHFIGDSTTSTTSTAPYSLENLYKVLNLIDHLDENVGINNEGAASLLGRLMFVFANGRFLNFHGEAHSRLERTFSVYGDPIYPRGWLVKTLAPLLFYAPDVHLITLQNMWVDKIMHKAVFEDLVQKMNDEWQQFVLFATVMLNANVAFLAIQSVDNDSNDPHRLAAQICSYLSVVASVGSILLGLLLVREFKAKDREAVSEIQQFFFDRNSTSMGLEVLAILFGLPYALLMWGMVSFVVGFAFLCFRASDLPTRTIVGISFLVVAGLVVLCIRTNWDKRKDPQPHPYDTSDQVPEEQGEADSTRSSVKKSFQLSARWLPSLGRSSSPQTVVNSV